MKARTQAASALPAHLSAPATSVPSVSPSMPSPLPTFQASDTPSPLDDAKSCQSAAGTVETQPFDLQGEGLSEVTIYLPPCYSAASPTRYPVLYFLHGVNNDDHQWVKIGAPAAADRLIHSGLVQPFLIVMPKEDSPTQNADQSTFDDALVNKLVPWVDQNYDTCTDRACRAIGGLSRGSGWALRIGLIHWELFGEIGAHSVSPFDGDLAQLATWVRLSPPLQHPRIYLDVGVYDMAVPDAAAVEKILTEMRVTHQWALLDGAHNEAYWSAHVQDYLAWYAEGWASP